MGALGSSDGDLSPTTACLSWHIQQANLMHAITLGTSLPLVPLFNPPDIMPLQCNVKFIFLMIFQINE